MHLRQHLLHAKGPDCIKDVIKPYGARLKVYNTIKAAIGESYKHNVSVVTLLYQLSSNIFASRIVMLSHLSFQVLLFLLLGR